jgi:N-methylhydantoinase A
VGAAIADLLEMRAVVIPPDPGVFSAVGLLLSDIEQERSRAFLRGLAAIDTRALEAAYAELERTVRADFAADGYRADDVTLARSADLRYAGQAHELSVPFAADLPAMAEAFGAEHARTYGHRAEAEAVECVALRVKGRVAKANENGMPSAARRSNGAATATRAAYFGPRHGQIDVPVLTRAGLAAADSRAGPLIVEEYDSTVVVPPGWSARVDAGATIHLSRE